MGVTAEGVVRFLRASNAPRLQLVVEQAMLGSLLAIPDLPYTRVLLSTDKHLFYERGGCGLYYC
jgi:hypothetical protein